MAAVRPSCFGGFRWALDVFAGPQRVSERIVRDCTLRVSYIANHALHGDTIFPGHGPVRTLYLSILASHVILSIVALPIVLTTFFFSLTGRFAMHRRIARLTFPIWLYVSITGVVVFVFLKAYAY